MLQVLSTRYDDWALTTPNGQIERYTKVGAVFLPLTRAEVEHCYNPCFPAKKSYGQEEDDHYHMQTIPGKGAPQASLREYAKDEPS
jgi:hypothetical protein